MSVFRRSRVKVEAPTFEGMEYSRWRAGADSFGPVGRVLLTCESAVLGVLGFGALYGNAFLGTGVPLGFAIGFYMVIAIPVGAWMLRRVWKRTRIK